jgi:hypothetical protein
MIESLQAIPTRASNAGKTSHGSVCLVSKIGFAGDAVTGSNLESMVRPLHSGTQNMVPVQLFRHFRFGFFHREDMLEFLAANIEMPQSESSRVDRTRGLKQ